jgi:hypothetical protein
LKKPEPLADWEREVMERNYERKPAESDKSHRASLLEEATSLVTGDRNNSYGPPHMDFQRTADAASGYGYCGPGGRPLAAHDIAILVMLVKISRLQWTPGKRDSWVDIAGYAACGFEASQLED